MKKSLKYTIYLLPISLIFSALLALLSSESFELAFINDLFIVGLILAILGGFMSIGETGFFKIANYPLHKVKFIFAPDKHFSDKKKLTFKQYMEEPIVKYPITKSILWTGLIIISICFIYSLFIY